MHKYLIIPIITFLAVGCSDPGVTMGSLLDEMISKQSVTEHPGAAYRSLQQSSYDRRSVSPEIDGWFANYDGFGFIRTETNEGRTEKVLFEDNGPGAITRIWLTTQNPAAIMRFYFDGSSIAGWMVPAYDLMQFGIAALGRGLLQPHTSYEQGVKGGSTLWLPVPYAKGCKVTLEEPDDTGRVPHYFHFNYRKYSENTKVETMSIAVVERYSSKIARIDALLDDPASIPAKGKALSAQDSIGEGDSLVIDLLHGTKVVNEVIFLIDGFSIGDYEKLMRGLVFSAEFDGRQTVWAPLADFSGGGMGAPPVDSWYLSSDGKGKVVCRWPMPYRETGRLMLKNVSDIRCEASLTATVGKYRWSDRSLYFHTTWKQERGLPFYNHAIQQNVWDWNFITISGRGVYRGDLLSLFNHSPAWYGEGDEKIYIDNETFPSHFGTGVEDYYNSSWAPVIPFHTPFGGAPRADLASSSGYNAFMRTRNLDDIPFAEKLCLDMEMMGWVDGTVDYATTSYWYGDKDARALKSSAETEEALIDMPLPPPDPAKFKIAGAIEMEDLKFCRKSENLTVDRQGMTEFSGGRWSRAAHLLGFGGRQGDYVEFVLSDLDDRPYNLQLYVTKAADYAELGIWVNGRRAANIDSYDNKVIPSSAIDLGTAEPVNGRIQLRVEITGKNPLSAGYVFGLDCITLSDK